MDSDHPAEEGQRCCGAAEQRRHLWLHLLELSDESFLILLHTLMIGSSVLLPQVRPLNVEGSLNLLGLETVRLIYFRNKMAGKNSQVHQVNRHEG